MGTQQKTKSIGCSRGVILTSLLILILSSLLPAISFAAAQEDFPKKEITFIVNFAPGGSRDILARGVGKTMSRHLGVPMVVINTPGAGGARGLINLFHSAPDGYTIGIGSPMDIVDQIFEMRGYDNKKFTYIGRTESSPNFLLVKSDSSFRSVKDFKTYGKPVRCATSGLTLTAVLGSMILAKREDFPLVVVGGYQSMGAATLSLVRGEVEFIGCSLSPVKSFVKAGQLRPILTIAPKRFPDFPDTPTVKEVGHPDLELFNMNLYLIAPPGVPKARAQILENALMNTLRDPEFLGWAKGAGVEPGPMNGEETTKLALEFFSLIEKYKGDIDKYITK